MFDNWPLIGKFMVAMVPSIMTAMALLTLCIALEVIGARDDRPHARWLGAAITAALPVLAGLLAMPFKLIWFALGVPPILDITGLPVALQVAFLIVFADFCGYWEHRFEHRFWWPVHSVHHSQTDLHAANSYGHPLQSITMLAGIIIPMSLVETTTRVPAVVGLALGFQLLFIHAPIRWHFGPFRRAFVDGPYHRIHHSLEQRHFGKNFGTGLTVWDQIFGTAYFPTTNEWPDTGVAGLPPPKHFTEYLAMPFRQWPAKWKSRAPQHLVIDELSPPSIRRRRGVQQH